MKAFLAVVLGLGALGMVSCVPFWGADHAGSVQPVQPGVDVGEHSSGFLSTVLGLPQRVIVGIFRGIGAILRFIFVRIPEGILDVIKRVLYRVGTVLGKKDPYDHPTSVDTAPVSNPSGYNQQTGYNGYNYGIPVYRNPYVLRK